MRRPTTRLIIVAGLLLIGACTVATNEEPVTVGEELFRDVLTTTSSSTTSEPDRATQTAIFYFLRNRDGATTLAGVPRSVDAGATTQEILNSLFTDRPDGDERPAEAGLSSAIPQRAELLSATIAPGTELLVVDTQGLFGPEGIQGQDLRNALAQIVFTAAEGNDVREVEFQNDGETQSALVASGETTDRPVTRADYRELR